MALTNGFANVGRLMSHFYDHAQKLGVATPGEYLERAEQFIAGPISKGTMECRRAFTRPGDCVRYNTVTDEYGVMTRQRVILTYYIADPAIHGHATNLEYFEVNCPPNR